MATGHWGKRLQRRFRFYVSWPALESSNMTSLSAVTIKVRGGKPLAIKNLQDAKQALEDHRGMARTEASREARRLIAEAEMGNCSQATAFAAFKKAAAEQGMLLPSE